MVIVAPMVLTSKEKMKTNERKNTRSQTQTRRKKATGRTKIAQSQQKKKGHQTKENYQTHIEAQVQDPPKKGKVERVFKGKVTNVPKYEDVGNLTGAGSRLDNYWGSQALIAYFPQFRSGMRDIPKTFKYWDHRWLLDHFQLNGWEFGNWTTQEDRLNYVCAIGISLYDLKTLLGLKKEDIGLRGRLGIAVGARGKGKALAHYEPWSDIINLTRYKAYGYAGSKLRLPVPDNPKLRKFLNTGGVGSFGHEYGHALDYWIGGRFDVTKGTYALSRGRSVAVGVDETLIKKKSPRGAMERVLKAIIWEDYPNKKPTQYYATLRAMAGNVDYWYRRNELFARAFEQYLNWKMGKKSQINSFLYKEKYQAVSYMPDAQMEKVGPLIDALMREIRKMLNT